MISKSKKQTQLLFLFVIIIVVVGFLFVYLRKNSFENFIDKINLSELRKKLTDNLNKNTVTVMKVPSELIEKDEDTCDIKCDAQSCIQMKEMRKNLEKCIECSQKKKCFRKTIIGGNCDDCQPGETPLDCSDTRNFGCAPPHNIQSYEGSLPYFISVPSKDLNSPFDSKCIFCWQFSDYI